MKYRLAIFDVDGTLLDTTEGIMEAVKSTVNYYALPELPHETLLSFIGPPIQDSFSKWYGVYGTELQDMADFFRKEYSCTHLLKAKPYNGVFHLLKELGKAGVRSAIATYKREDYALTLLKHFGFDRYTNIMYGGDNANKLKKRDIVVKCIEKSGIADKNSMVIIGDTLHDASSASDLGIDFIAVTYGFGFKGNAFFDNDYLGYANNTSDIYNLITREQ